MFKRLAAGFLAVMLILTFCGCDGFGAADDALLSPPRAGGEYALISEVLKKSITGKYTLKYPSSGEYRSAIVLKDINNDSSDEAVAFYTTAADNTVTVHINLIAKINGEYISVGSSKIVGSGVERVEFCDLDGDGKQEIIVGYYVFGNVDKQVAVYEYSSNTLVQRALEKYTEFVVCDLDGNGVSGLCLTLLDAAQKTASAKLLQITKKGVTQLGTCALDGNVTSYYRPVISKLSDGRLAVLVDAVKGTGMITEVLCYEKDALVNTFFDTQLLSTTATYRQSLVASRDIDGDGSVEIPMLQSLPGAKNIADTENVALTKWCKPSGDKLVVTRTMLMNYTDGYSLDIPTGWTDICVAKKTDSRLRVIYVYNQETGLAGEEILRMQAVAEKTWDGEDYQKDNFTELTRANGLVFAYRFGPHKGTAAITNQKLEEIFKIIEEEK